MKQVLRNSDVQLSKSAKLKLIIKKTTCIEINFGALLL